MKYLLVALAVAYLPAVATGADSPPPTYIDKGACPLECCTYRAWRTNADTVAYAKPDKSAKMVGRLKAGATIEAIYPTVSSAWLP